MDRYREATLRPRRRDGADDGQSEAVVIVDAGAVGLAESLTPLQHTAGWGFRDLGTARVPSKRGLAWCAQNGK